MISYEELRKHYEKAYKRAKKSFFLDRLNNRDPYLKSLDEIVDVYKLTQVNLGEIEIPSELIVGTKTSLRKTSFNRDFMPLLKPNSEFFNKWIQVCQYHLSDTGISEAPKVYEYFGKFYVEEGNKRVSVLKSYGAVFIPCEVIRVLPVKDNSKESRLYYEFLDFYKYSKLYSLQFDKYGCYEKLVKLLGYEKEHVFERRERIRLIGFYGRLKDMLIKKKLVCSYPDSLINLMEIYTYERLSDMSDKELSKAIDDNKVKLENDVSFYNLLCVADEEDRGLWSSNKERFKDYDFILSSGDLKSEYLEYLVTVSNKPLFYVHGNHDDPYDKKEPLGCECIDDRVIVYKGLRILGLGGSYKYKSNSKYMYTEKEMRLRIKRITPKIKKVGGIDIIVTHAPIKDYGDLNDYAHQGFECFKELIKKYKPKYLFYGHVHNSYDSNANTIFVIDNTKVINVCDKKIIKF